MTNDSTLTKDKNVLAWKEIVARYQKPSVGRGVWQIVNTLVPYAALWYLKKDARLSPIALHAMEAATRAGLPIFLSPISLVEVCYLIEKGKLPLSDWPVTSSPSEVRAVENRPSTKRTFS